MSLLSIIRFASFRVGVTAPNTVIGNTDQRVQELLTVAQEEGEQLMRRGTWEILRGQVLYSAVNQEIQTGMIPSDYDRFIQETFWNRTRKRPIWGPVTPQEWQNLKAWSVSPVVDTFCVRGGNILVQPDPTAGDIFAYEYIKKTWCQSAAGVAQDEWLADTDTGVLDEKIMRMGVIWRYKQKKGLAWETDFNNWDSQVMQALGQDQPQRTVNLGTQEYVGRMPGIAVPQGSWSV
jgi:hypothetical protein